MARRFGRFKFRTSRHRSFRRTSYRGGKRIFGLKLTTVLMLGVLAYLFTPFKDVVNGIIKKK